MAVRCRSMSSNNSTSPGPNVGRTMGVSRASSSTSSGPTAQSKYEPRVPVSTISSSRRGRMSRPGASAPQCESDNQMLSARMPRPRKAPSWCQPALVSTGTRRSVHLLAESAGRSPRYAHARLVQPEHAERLEQQEQHARRIDRQDPRTVGHPRAPETLLRRLIERERIEPGRSSRPGERPAQTRPGVEGAIDAVHEQRDLVPGRRAHARARSRAARSPRARLRCSAHQRRAQESYGRRRGAAGPRAATPEIPRSGRAHRTQRGAARPSAARPRRRDALGSFVTTRRWPRGRDPARRARRRGARRRAGSVVVRHPGTARAPPSAYRVSPEGAVRSRKLMEKRRRRVPP